MSTLMPPIDSARQRLRVFGHLVRTGLQSHEATEAGVLSYVHNAHSATAELLNYMVVGKGLSHE